MRHYGRMLSTLRGDQTICISSPNTVLTLRLHRDREAPDMHVLEIKRDGLKEDQFLQEELTTLGSIITFYAAKRHLPDSEELESWEKLHNLDL